jgi:hypothetical protein
MQLTAPATRRTAARDADGMAVASFILGLLGLLVLNLFLGPVAIALAGLAPRSRHPPPRPRLPRSQSRHLRHPGPPSPHAGGPHGVLEFVLGFLTP